MEIYEKVVIIKFYGTIKRKNVHETQFYSLLIFHSNLIKFFDRNFKTAYLQQFNSNIIQNLLYKYFMLILLKEWNKTKKKLYRTKPYKVWFKENVEFIYNFHKTE